MGLFDERVLTSHKDLKPGSFKALLGEAGFSHNTLQQHLDRLAAQGLVVKEKMASTGLGRPKFTFRVPSTAAKQVIVALENAYGRLVTLRFARLRSLRRFEKGGYCKKKKEEELCASNLSPNPKIRLITILHQLFNLPARGMRGEELCCTFGDFELMLP